MKISTLLLFGAGVVAGCLLSSDEARACADTPDASFAGMDLDQDGKVSAAEHTAATRRMYATMDRNADGKVSAAEMDAAHGKLTGRKTRVGDLGSVEKIRTIDQNGDRVLSAAEHEAGSAMKFASMDANKDGRLSRAEYDKGHASLKRGVAKGR